MKKIIYVVMLAVAFLFAGQVRAMPVGTLLYRSSGSGLIYGYNTKDLLRINHGVLADVYTGHVGVYVGKINGEDYVVEALGKGIVKMPAKYFVNTRWGEKYLGAKLPKNASEEQRFNAVELAKNLADYEFKYDFDFHDQKGPASGQWICSGVAEKIYESANADNPSFRNLEYDPLKYAVDITPDGYDKTSIYNLKNQDCFSESLEYSKISPNKETLVPAPEIFGFNSGREYDNERYFFFPYTQFLQPNLEDVDTDIQVESDFDNEEIRGAMPQISLVLKWSLINNPVSSLKQGARKLATWVNTLVGGNSDSNLEFSALASEGGKASSTVKSKATASKKTLVKKSTAKKAPAKKTSAKKTSVKKVAAKKDDVSEKKTSSDNIKKSSSAKTVSKLSSNKNSLNPESNLSLAINKPSSIPKPQIKTNNLSVAPQILSFKEAINNPVISENKNPAGTVVNNIVTEKIVYTPPVSLPATVLISRVYLDGDDKYIELYNFGSETIDLAQENFRLEKTKSAADPSIIVRVGNEADGEYPGGTEIDAHGYYRLAAFSSSSKIKESAQAIISNKSFTWFDSGYTFYLGKNAISSNSDPDIIDKLGFGEAEYFEGLAPAPAIIEPGILVRKTSANTTAEDFLSAYNKGSDNNLAGAYDSNNNNLDWLSVSLAKEDPDNDDEPNNPGNTGDSGNPANPGGEPNNASSTTPIDNNVLAISGLTHLWNFSECRGAEIGDKIGSTTAQIGTGEFVEGFFDCALIHDYQTGSFKATTTSVDANNFSFNFFYKKTDEYSRPAIRFFGQDFGNELSIKFYSIFTEISGLPDTEWRVESVQWPYGDAWHAAALVVNAEKNYWALYNDGVEVYKKSLQDFLLPHYKNIEINDKGNRSILDEISVFNRALTPAEIKKLHLSGKSLVPVLPRPNDAPLLLHHWDFSEKQGTSTIDKAQGVKMIVPPVSWINKTNNSYIFQDLFIAQKIEVDLAEFYKNNPAAIKLSEDKGATLEFWWRNRSYPDEGRAEIYLNTQSGAALGLTATYYNPRYCFNGDCPLFNVSEIIPNDADWHHLAISYDSYERYVKVFVDGLEKFKVFKPSLNLVDFNQIVLENHNFSYEIDDLKLWQGALASKYILDTYNKNPNFR